jgi:heparosan-N-sulfate-glucuronate 5-epimerase
MMQRNNRINYYRRIFSAYLTGTTSHLTFWHEQPEVNENFRPGVLGEYYMPFFSKADYAGHYDDRGIPMLDYRGAIGLQHNPIAVAQYGLGNYNLYRRTGEESRRARFLKVADWLVDSLEEAPGGVRVWNHHFDWEYRDTLKAPWHSALAQGQGISVLVRACGETGDEKYLNAARDASEAFRKDVREGGVVYADDREHPWLEEYIVFPPTHILNGFIWASWGVYDYFLATEESWARKCFERAMDTLKANLHLYDCGFWSLYEQSGTRLKMMASPFYHKLHVTQLQVLHKLTGEELFRRYSDRWARYRSNPVNRHLALAYKALFKLLYY